MKYSHLKKLIQESGLSPEELAGPFGVSNMTLRRWSKEPGGKEIPAASTRLLVEGVHQLVSEGVLKANSETVQEVLADSPSRSFEAVLSGMGVASTEQSPGSSYEEKMTMALFQIGSNKDHQDQVEKGEERLSWFKKQGTEWKNSITTLTKVVRDRSFSTVEKMIAYGALFYLIAPMDLVPDALPFAGVVDDYGVLILASAYYMARIQKPPLK